MAEQRPEGRTAEPASDVGDAAARRAAERSGHHPEPTPPPPGRRDRASRYVAIAILAAIIVPMVWLIISTAITGYDTDEPDRFPVVTRPSP